MGTVLNQTGYRVSKDWLERVDGVVKTVTTPPPSESSRYLWSIIRVVYTLDDWTLDQEYHTRARFCDDAGSVISNSLIELFCPLYLGHSGPGRGAPPVEKNQRCWSIFRGSRWEYLSTIQEVSTLTAGAGIVISAGTVYNVGLLDAFIEDDSHSLRWNETGAITFSKYDFKRISGVGVGENYVALKTKRVRVVEDIVNGAPSYIYLTVIDY